MDPVVSNSAEDVLAVKGSCWGAMQAWSLLHSLCEVSMLLSSRKRPASLPLLLMEKTFWHGLAKQMVQMLAFSGCFSD